MRISVLIAAALIAAAPAIAQTPEQRAELEIAAERGRLLAVLDRTAARATRAMLGEVTGADREAIEGYVIEPGADGEAGAVVTFYGSGADGPVALYRAAIARDGSVAGEAHAAGQRPALTPVQRRMAAAREAALALGRSPCEAEVFNAFVLPLADADAPAEVYLLSPQTRRDAYPAGGHYRATFDAEGGLVAEEAVAGPCAPLPLEGTGTATLATDEALPREIHMYLALKTGRRLAVTAEGREWRVDATGIAPAGADDDAERVRARDRDSGR